MTLEQKIKNKLISTVAWDLLRQSGCVEEANEELISTVKEICIELARETYEEGYDAATHHEEPNVEQFIKDKV